MHCKIELSRSALVSNFRLLHQSWPSTELKEQEAQLVAPVLKSNAYGHGFEQVFEALREEKGLRWLAVNYCKEGADLRRLGFEGRILVVGPIMAWDWDLIKSGNLEPFVSHRENLEKWISLDSKPAIHLKVDTGMGRQGFLLEDMPSVLDAIPDKDRSQVKGLATHFANVEDVTVHEYANQQLDRFQSAKLLCEQKGFSGLIFHCASSASSLILKESQFHMARVGISLYGFWPSSATRLSFLNTRGQLAQLRPVLRWSTKVAQVKSIQKDSFIGYGCTFRAYQDMRIAVIPVGYFEGYPRLAGDRSSYVLISGSRSPIVGRICMNMMMVDVSHLKEPKVGDEVILIGTQGAESITAEQMAAWADTIHYELVTCLNPGIPRILVD